MRKELPEAASLQKWFRAVARALFKKNGRARAIWETPSGWEVVHEPMKAIHAREVDIAHRHGRRKVSITDDWGPNESKFRSGFAPNVIHSLDAAHLTMTIRAARARGVYRFAAVHDCYGTHAGNVEVLRNCLREVFASDEFAGVAQTMLDKLEAQSGEARAQRGDLDLAVVLESDYFFD